MADWSPTAVSKSSNFVTGPLGNKTKEVLADLLANRTEIYSLISDVAEQFYGPTPPANYNVGTLWRCSATAGSYVANTTYRWSGTAWVVDYASTLAMRYRNVVLTGPVDGSGFPAMFTAGTGRACNLAATVRIAFANGYDDIGAEVNYYGVLSSNASSFWSSLPANQTSYLYIDRTAGGVLSGGFTTIAPVYQSYAPTNAAGKHWFDTNAQVMYYGDGSTWTKVWRVFVGTAITDGSSVTAVSNYPYGLTLANADYAYANAIFNLSWTEKFLLSSPAAGFVSPYNPLSRNGTLSAVVFYPKGTPSAATTVNLMHGTGNSLAAALNSSATSATLASAITLSAATNMLIDDEVVQITAIGGTTLSGTAVTGTALTIVRAQGSTTAAAHDNGTATLLQIATASLSTKSPVAVTGLSVQGSARNPLAYHVAGGGLSSIPCTIVQEWGNR